MTELVMSPNGTGIAARGFRPKRRTRRAECAMPDYEPHEGFDPIWIEVVVSFTQDDLTRIQLPRGEALKAITQAERWELIAPYVVAWNVLAETTDGEWAPLPAPADAGPEVFGAIEAPLFFWIDTEVQSGWMGDLRDPKRWTPSALTDGTGSDDGAANGIVGSTDSAPGSTTPKRKRSKNPSSTDGP